MSHVADLFLAAVPAEGRAAFEPRDQLHALLSTAIERGRTAWPAVDVPLDVFVRHLARRSATIEELAGLSAAGLWIASACAEGDPVAMRCFDEAFRRDVVRVLGRMGVATMTEEVAAGVLASLFAGDPPGIAAYRGTGEVLAWVRVVAVREAHRILREQRRIEQRERSQPEDELLERATASSDPEIERLKNAYRVEFKQAFEKAFADLPARDRTLLRYHLLDQLKLEQIAIVFDISRATAARWLAQARASLLELSRRRLSEALDLSRHELDSVMKLIQSDLDVSITRVLRAGEASD
jgi:RNA polymerase sigma-70 factor (ECF subfamily)